VLLGNGDGTFQPGRGHAAGPAAFAAAAGDFTGDGWLDAFTANSVLINDQSWPPAVSIGGASVTEGNAGTAYAIFTLSLSFASDQPATVYFATADGSATAGRDYAAGSGDVTFEPGETSKTMTVAVFADRIGEGYEGFLVNLTGATGAVIGNGTGYGSIVDDEPRVSINSTWGLEGNTGTTPFAFIVTLSAAYDAPVAVNFATADGFATTAGGDYQAASGTLTIPAGQTSGTIPVLVNGDRFSESGEYDGWEGFYINLTSPTAFVVGGRGVGTILDDEPRIRIGDVSAAEGKTGQTTLFTFTVTLSAAYDQAVTMSFRTIDGRAKAGQGDYVARTGTLTFAPGETSKTVTIEVKGDSKREADETFYLDLSGLSSNGTFTKSRGTGTILNDD
jgi:large repetitive protein